MNFKKHIVEAKNTHMVHIEDMVIDGGVTGARAAIFALRDLRDMLAGTTNAKKEVTVNVIQMAHYRKAEVYYNHGAFDKAIE